jgi:hypothetical protein
MRLVGRVSHLDGERERESLIFRGLQCKFIWFCAPWWEVNEVRLRHVLL